MRYPSAEIRWFFPGAPPPALEAWFRQSWTGVGEASRTDHYLRGAGETLNVKLREGRVEVKQRTGAEPCRCVRRTLTGQLEEWVKWSFGLSAAEDYLRLALDHPEAWVAVYKRRLLRTFLPKLEKIVETAPGSFPPRGCNVELTFLQVSDQPWFSIGLEAFGESADRKGLVRSVADFLLDEDFPLLLTQENSMGYAAWLMRAR